MTHILVNGLSARLGGGQTYLRNLLLHAPNDGSTDVTLLCQDSLNLASLPPSVVRQETPASLINPFRRALWEERVLPDLVTKHKIDLVFSPGGLLPRSLSSVKLAVAFQNMLPFDAVQGRKYGFSYRRFRDILLKRSLTSAMRRADLVVFISEFARGFIERSIGPLRGRAVTIPHGIDRRFFAGSERAAKPHAAPDSYFLYVSFIDYYKAQIEVVRAYAELKRRTGTTAKLVLAGAEYPPYGRELRDEIARLDLDRDVLLPGNLPHEQLPGWYQNAAVNLFASRTENCPNILLEIMAAGRPALVSTYPPMPEFGLRNVQYFDPDDVPGLASAWAQLLGDPAHAEARAAAARAHVSGMTWERAAAATWDAFRDVAQASP